MPKTIKSCSRQSKNRTRGVVIISKWLECSNPKYHVQKVIHALLKKIPAEDHSLIWNSLFEIEQDARLIRDKLASDFRLRAEIIKVCSNDVNERMD